MQFHLNSDKTNHHLDKKQCFITLIRQSFLQLVIRVILFWRVVSRCSVNSLKSQSEL